MLVKLVLGIIHISQTDCKLKQKQPFFLYVTVNVQVILQFLQPHMQHGLNCELLESVTAWEASVAIQHTLSASDNATPMG